MDKMIIRSKLTKGQIESLKQGDTHELFICDANNNNKVVKLLIKLESFIKEKQKCSGCGIILKGKFYEWDSKKWCLECLNRHK